MAAGAGRRPRPERSMNRRYSRKELFHGLFDQLRETAGRAIRPTPEPGRPLLRPPGALFPDPPTSPPARDARSAWRPARPLPCS